MNDVMMKMREGMEKRGWEVDIYRERTALGHGKIYQLNMIDLR